MATTQTNGYKQRRLWGRSLVTLGVVALLADLAFLAGPLTQLIEKMRDGLLGVIPALGLSFLSAARAIAFHQIDYFSLVSRILVLFSAMVAVVVGTALWNARQAPNRASLPGSVEGDR
ncbi:MAG: hypothetical protein WBE13_13940 [Candidatus Acidiferrum sp.]